MRTPILIPILILILPLLVACADSKKQPPLPYDADTTTVIGAGGVEDGEGSLVEDNEGASIEQAGSGPGIAVVTTPDGEQCIQLDDECLMPQGECGDKGTADVIVGEDGEVLSVICYPNKNYDVEIIGEDEPVMNPDLGNNTVIVLDDVDDGADIEGDVTVTGNNVIIYGQGPDTSVIDGNLNIEKNNTIVRGVRITGDATITKNNASLIYCVIEGDLTITGNNVNLALCEIWGRVQIDGNNAVFVSNLVGSDDDVDGVNLQCNDNHHFSDTDEDGTIADAEIGDAIVCKSRGGDVADDPDLKPKKAP